MSTLWERGDIRVVGEYDPDPTNPRVDQYMITGVHNAYGSYRFIDRFIEPVHTFPGDIQYAFGHTDVVRWARAFYDITLVRDDSFLWWADPTQMQWNFPELTRGSEAYIAKEYEVIRYEMGLYEAYADGEVFMVSMEKCFTWVRADDASIQRQEWEVIEQVGGLLGMTDAELLDAAREFFDFEKVAS